MWVIRCRPIDGFDRYENNSEIFEKAVKEFEYQCNMCSRSGCQHFSCSLLNSLEFNQSFWRTPDRRALKRFCLQPVNMSANICASLTVILRCYKAVVVTVNFEVILKLNRF